MASLRPIHDWVLARRYLQEAVSPGGIIIPDNAQKMSQRAEVVAVGPGRALSDGTRVVPACKPGDFIAIGNHSGTAVEIDGDAYVMVRADDILGVEDATVEYAQDAPAEAS